MSSFSRPCNSEKPMYRKKKLSGLYSQSKRLLPAESLINSLRMEGDAGGGGRSGDSGISSISSRTVSSPSGSSRGSVSSSPEDSAGGSAQGSAGKTRLIDEFIRGEI